MMKKVISLLLALCLLCGLGGMAFAGEAIVTAIDFSGADALDGWKLNGNGTMDIVDGELQLGITSPYSEAAAVYTAQEYGNFTAEFTYHFEEGINNDGAMFLYHTDEYAATGYAVYFVHCPDVDRQYYIKFTSRPYAELQNGMFYNDGGAGVDYDEDVQVKIVVSDGTHSLYVTKPGGDYGEPVYSYTEETPLYTSGHVGFMHWHENDERQSTVAFNNLKITGEAVSADGGGNASAAGQSGGEAISTDSLDGWKLNGNGTMDIVDGELQLGITSPYSEAAAVYTAQEYGNFTAEFTYHFVEGINNDGAMFLYHTDEYAATGYAVYFVHCPDADRQYYIKFTSRPYAELQNGMFYNDGGAGVDYDEDVQVKIVVSDGTHSLYVTKPGGDYGEPVYSYTEETPLYTSGHVGFMHWHENDERQSTVAFNNLKITGEAVSADGGGNASAAGQSGDEAAYEAGTLLWESDLSSGDLESAGLTIQYLPENAQAAWDIIDLNGTKTLRGQIAMFNDTIVRLTDGKYKDVTIEANINLERGNAVSIIGRLQDDGRGYAIILDQHDGIKLCQKNPYVAWKTGGIVETDTEYHVVLSMSGDQIKAKVTNLLTNESIIHEMKNDAYMDAGYVGFAVFGFDNDGVSTATGLIRDIKVYAGALDLDTLGSQEEGPADSDENEPEFYMTAKYTDATVDSAAKKVTLTQPLTVAELKGSFDVPEGYSVKVVDKDGKEITNGNASVNSEMKLIYFRDGADEQVYSIEAPSSSNTAGIIIAVVVVLAIAAAAAVVVIGKKKKVK